MKRVRTEDCPTRRHSDEEDEDCGSLDVAGSDDDQVAGDADTDEEDCGSLDVAGSEDEEDCGSLDVAGSEDEEDCGSLDVAGSEDGEDCGSLDVAGSAVESTTLSESSLNFDDIAGSYTSAKVQPQEQN
ncbi:uncharacterized protein KRP23_14901 [Phytophthora ramorum]|uniref:uncharacterized protein n=1 Tax=Phytophthora ramorum TaxID=164328 RepID=UPI0030A727D2|nr:hypothetical protein KRP23_14901 [Phytophthora ramorum]